MSAGPPQGGSFSLFPRDRPPSRNQMNAVAGARPSMDSVSRDSPSRNGRRTPLERKMSIRDGKKPEPAAAAPESAPNANTSPSSDNRPAEPIIQRPAPVAAAEPPPRCGTAFSEAQTLVRDNSGRSRNSIAKLPLPGDDEQARRNHGPGADYSVAPMRSIFPEYNPNIPLAQQNYYPTQTSPARIPPEAISRRLYSPTSDIHPTSPRNQTQGNNHQQQQQQQQQQSQSPPLRSPRSIGTAASSHNRRWPPPRANDALQPAAPPEPSTTEQLRDYWKVANGWKAAASEGRVYTFKVACERDAPVYTLASRAGQPFYRMRLDPTSASAYVSLARFDPFKTYKPPVPPKDNTAGGGGSGENVSAASFAAGKETAVKGWQEVIATTLEDRPRRHHAPPPPPPGGDDEDRGDDEDDDDGLVSLLFPLVAARLAAADGRFTGAAAYAAAERECARLVWDGDSGNHFLVHPALAMPFCVTVERNPTWSRTEYTLEHVESPRHLARLTRDGTGGGWLEVDTGIASKIDSVYLADVAVAALLLVAHADGEFSRAEVFEPPPASLGGGGGGGGGGSGRNSRQDGRSSRLSRLSARIGTGDKRKAGRSRLEEFELDLESQASDLKKHSSKDKDGVPGCARAIISLLKVTFKCFIWCATVAFRALTGLISLLARCLTSEKL